MWSAKLVTFDVTGTLLTFRTPVFDKYLEVGAQHGLKIDVATFKRNYEEAWIALNKQHPNYGSTTGLGWQNWWGKFAEKSFVSFVKPEETHRISNIVKELIDHYTTKEAFSILPGTVDLLEYLRTKPLQLGVISNYDPRLHQILDFMDLKKYFNFILVSYEFGHSKPDAKIFQEALRLGDCPSADGALHIGDDMNLDYFGAKEAGLRAALISSNEKDLNHCKVNKNEVFKDFYELKTHLQKVLMD